MRGRGDTWTRVSGSEARASGGGGQVRCTIRDLPPCVTDGGVTFLQRSVSLAVYG